MQRPCPSSQHPVTRLSRPLAGVVLTLALVACAVDATADEERDGGFGFAGLSIFKFHRNVGPLATTDVDGDGRRDIIVVDNYRAEIVILYQDPKASGKTHGTGANTIDDPDGFRRATLTSSLAVQAMLTHDVDGDGHVELILSGPGTLEVRWGSDSEPFKEKSTYRVREGLSGRKALVADDDRQAGFEVFVLAQKGVHRFRAFSRTRSPQRSFLTGSAGSPTSLYIADVDGDGRRDLVTLLNDAEHPYRLRLRRPDGDFGPEFVIAGERPADIVVLENDRGAEIISLALGKSRFDVLTLSMEERRDPFDLPAPEVFPLDAAGLEDPRLLVADIDGDGDDDIVVTDRQNNALRVFANDRGQLLEREPSPTLRKVGCLQAGDIDGDGKPELLVTSAEEKVVGASRVVSEKLRFPEVLAGIDAPLLAAPGNFRDGGSAEIAVVTRKSNAFLQIVRDGADGWSLGEPPLEVSLADLGSDPSDILVHDVDGDGRDEVVLFAAFRPPRVYRVESDALVAINAPGSLEKAARGAVTVAAGGDLLVAAGNHCRRVRIRDGKASVVYQVNGQSGTSLISCAVEARLESGKPPYLVLVDRSDRSLSVYGGDAEQPTCLRTLNGPYDRIRTAAAVDLDADGRDEIVLLDDRFLAVIRTDGRRLAFQPSFSYQNPDEDCRYVAAAGGDLDGDGTPDLLLSNGAQKRLQILKKGETAPWVHALRFPVYEAKSFSGAGRGPMEPRWIDVVDLNGDSLEDVIMLIHDRVILYPQDVAQ